MTRLRQATHLFNELAPATRERLMPLILAGSKGVPLSTLTSYEGESFARWKDEHGLMLEGMGYHLHLSGFTNVRPAQVFCTIDVGFVQDLALFQQLVVEGRRDRDPLWC